MRMTTDSAPTFLVGILAALFAAAMCVYAWMFVVPAWNFAQAEPRYAQITHGKVASVVELDAVTQALRASPMRGDLNRAAFVQMLTAQQVGLKTLRATTRLLAARRDLRRGLAVAPSDVYAWTRLAVSEQRLGNLGPAAAALAMALEIAPNERKLTAVHFDLAVLLWPQLDSAGRAAVQRRLTTAEKWPDLAPTLAGNSAVVLRQRLQESGSD